MDGRECYYAFVRQARGKFEAFLEHASVVMAEARATEKLAEKRPNKKWAPGWPMTGQDAAEGAGAEIEGGGRSLPSPIDPLPSRSFRPRAGRLSYKPRMLRSIPLPQAFQPAVSTEVRDFGAII
jgi:hypothetical protein